MAARGTRSLEGQRGYAYHVAGWIDFLHDAYGIDYLDAGFEDLDEYGRELRTSSENPVSGVTWNRKLAAIHDFYPSLVRDGRLAPGDGPFAAPNADRELRSRAVGARAVRYLSLAQLRHFVDVRMRATGRTGRSTQPSGRLSRPRWVHGKRVGDDRHAPQ